MFLLFFMQVESATMSRIRTIPPSTLKWDVKSVKLLIRFDGFDIFYNVYV